MTKEELKKEAEEKAGIYFDSLDYDHGNVSDTPFSSYDVYTAYKKGALDFAEPREKQIERLSKEVDDSENMKATLESRIADLQAQIEKLIDFVLSKIECCDVCPITNTCINSEGTCPYAGILAKGEEEVTREWLMQFISKEIKEK